MDSYYQALGEAASQKRSVAEQVANLNQINTQKADTKKEAILAFGEPLLADGLNHSLADLASNVSKKASKELEKRGVIPEGSTKNLGKIVQDFKDGGLKRVVNENLSPALDQAAAKAKAKITQNLDVNPELLPDIDSLTGSKITSSAEHALYNPTRNLASGYSSPFEVGDMTMGLKGSKSTFQRATEHFDANDGRSLSDVLRPITQEEPFSQPTGISRTVKSISANAIKTGGNAETAGEDILKGAKKAAKVDTELGGEENILGDVVAVGTGLATTLGGIFGVHHKQQAINPDNVLNPSLSLGTY